MCSYHKTAFNCVFWGFSSFFRSQEAVTKTQVSSHICHNKKNRISKAMRTLSHFVTLFVDERSMISHNHSITTVSGTAQHLAMVSTVHVLIEALSQPQIPCKSHGTKWNKAMRKRFSIWRTYKGQNLLKVAM